MAVDYFLKLDGIEGESVDKTHPKEIELLSFSWGVSQAGAGAPAGGGAAGNASFQDLVFAARVSKASPRLFLACASGQHVKSAVLTCRRSGARQAEFLQIKLSDVLVSSYQVGGSAPEEPTDQASLSFGRIEVEYTPVGKGGKAERAVKAGWDLKTSKKL